MLAEHMARVVNRVVDLLDIRADLPEVGDGKPGIGCHRWDKGEGSIQ